jgi:CDP-paratose 2-epimerase
MKILITGICGFVGSALSEVLLQSIDGLTIVGFDNLIRPGSETNRMRLKNMGVRVFHGDMRMPSDLSVLPAVDWVIDAAAHPSVLAGVDGSVSSRQLVEHNLSGMLQLLEYCKATQAGLLLLSTSRVYSIPALAAIPLKVCGEAFHLDTTNPLPCGLSERGIGPEFSTAPPISLYGSTKLASEVIALEYGSTFGFPVWITRCGVLAGAGQFGTSDQGIFAYWINAHLRRRPLRFIGFEAKGYQVRDALHPADLAELQRRQIGTGRSGGRRIYTAGGGPANAMSLASLTRWCDTRFAVHKPQPELKPRPFDVPWMVMDNREAERDFGWQPSRPIESICEEIALHAEGNPEWLELSAST